MKALLHDWSVTLDRVVEYLDGMDVDGRVAATSDLTRAEILQLYLLAGSAAPLDFGDFVPDDRAALAPVHHQGRNSLFAPARFRRFQKRFCRQSDNEDSLVGYNEFPGKWWLGPGYFALRQSAPPQLARGAVYVDYVTAPQSPFPASWPSFASNEKGLSRFIYGGTHDYMRRVGAGVTVGMPYKGDRLLPFPFVLVRLA